MSVQQTEDKMVPRIEKIISDGNHKPTKIAHALGADMEVLLPVLNALTEVGYLQRENEGTKWEFYLGDTEKNVAMATDEETDGMSIEEMTHSTELDTATPMEDSAAHNMPVNRDYNFDGRVPKNVPTFYQTDGEIDEIKADLKQNKIVAEQYGFEKARAPRFWFTGPTGCGKTHAARKIAEEEDAALFTIQGKYSMNEADLLGMPLLIDNETVWVDGPLTKALISSQERKTVLLIDEANRARPEAKSALFSVLDDRCAVELESRGGEIIEGDPMNLISFATVNEGDGYQTQKMDLAEMRRFGNKLPVTYLGIERPEKEIELVTERSMAPEPLASELVKAANEIREEAANAGEVKRGIPTALVIDWARTAYGASAEGLNNPVLRAARSAVIRPFYKNDNSTFVEDTISDRIDGAPFTADELHEWAEKDMNEFVSENNTNDST